MSGVTAWLPGQLGGAPAPLVVPLFDDVAVAHEPGVNPLVRLWGPHKADGPSASSTSTWRYVLPHSDDGVTAVFRIALSQSAMVSTRAVGRRVDGYGVAIEIPTKEELAALKGSMGVQQAALKAEGLA